MKTHITTCLFTYKTRFLEMKKNKKNKKGQKCGKNGQKVHFNRLILCSFCRFLVPKNEKSDKG